MQFKDYQLKSKIAESDYFSVFKGICKRESSPAIIKAVKEERISLSQKNKLNHEFTIGSQLSGEHTIRYLYNGTEENIPFIVLEDFGAQSLAEYIQEKQLSIPEFFTVAKAITRALFEIHEANVIHKDINPQNILYNPETQKLKIADFGISSTLKKEVQKEVAVNALEGTLEYLSPEQTGRMNREIDFRSDFYSLGITLYELLAGRRPFLGKDKLDLVHAHLALNPTPLNSINPKVPDSLVQIVDKLMAKNAENRYQSARGLYHDLEQAEAFFNKKNSETFVLGEQDSSAYFSIPGKLYGRDREINTLLEAFENVCEGGREVVMVSGYSGIGKSALVKEIHKPVTSKKANFVKGKYDQYQTNKPYYGMIEAYRSLILQFLVEGDESIAKWKTVFLEAFGPNGQLMIDVIPELELIIGPQPPVAELRGDAAKTRFTLLFRNFIRALTSSGNPLVVFLDDLQWADIETINIIRDLLKLSRNDVTKSLFLIGAYRDNEVSEAHPLVIMLEEVKEFGVQITDLNLSPIRLEDVCKIVMDTFNCSEEKATDLAQIVFQKTGGNPFFVNQFLSSLYLEELVVYDLHSGSWIWDIEKIKSRGYTDNIIDLMIKNIEKLDRDAIEVLKIASALGAKFNLDTLLLIVDQDKKELVESLRKSVDAGLITQDSYSSEEVKTYEFLHDRIQQASYSFLEEEELINLHYRIGKILLSRQKEGDQNELFDVVNHLNQARSLFRNEEERLELAGLNFEASQKAKNSNAYFAAMEYLENAIDFLSADSWKGNYPLSLDIFSSAVEVSFLNKDYEKMDRLIGVLDKEAKELIDKIPSYEIKIQALAAQSKLLEAIEEARKILSLIGVTLPKNPGQLQIMSGLISTKLLTGRKKPMSLLQHKEMKDPLDLAAMRILISTTSSAFLAMPDMFPLIVFNMVKLSHKKGISKYSSYGYACYGLIHCGV
nr:serine/threonine-protein kinase PknK [Saprospiraceae bacterium]